MKLGGPKLKQAQRRGIASNKANADELCTNVLPVIQQIKASCVSAWNKDPVFGVIGIQSGPRG